MFSCDSFSKHLFDWEYILDFKMAGCDALLEGIKVKTTAEVQARTVQDLISRLIPERANEFVVQVDSPSSPQNEYFEVFVLTRHLGQKF